MTKKIDNIPDHVWIDLCSRLCLRDVCREVGSYREAVLPKLKKLGLQPQKYDHTKHPHSKETKMKRAESLANYHRMNPTARRDQTEAIRAHALTRKGKTFEVYYGEEEGKRRKQTLIAGHSYRTNKSYSQIFGEERAREICKKRSISSLGKVHSESAILKMSTTRKEKMASGEIKLSPRAGCGLGGFRADIGHYVRSSYEHYFSRELQKQNIKYEYEPEIFKIVVDGVNSTYTPDFLIDGVYYELKNTFNVTDEKFTKKLKAFKEQYPSKTVVVIVGTRKEEQYSHLIETYVKG